MNSFSVIAMDNVSEEIKAVLDSAYEFPQEKIDLALDYQWVSRVLSECHQLYQLFDWNCDSCRQTFAVIALIALPIQTVERKILL